MKKTRCPNRYRRICVMMFLFFIQSVLGQLPDFSLTVTKTDETCSGNGSLTFNTANTAAGAIILYSIYALPDTVNPLVVLSGNTITGLSSGTYRIVALQSLGSLSNTQQREIQINRAIFPLQYQVSGVPVLCGSTGSITVTTVQGNPVSYEIVSGPVVRPPQSSNTFDGLTIGEYQIKVTDACGDALVHTYTVTVLPSTLNLDIITASEQDCELLTCTSRNVNFTIIAPLHGSIVYPLQMYITVYPPDNGAAIIFNQTIASGDAESQIVGFPLPFYDVPFYNVRAEIFDQCGATVMVPDLRVPNIRSILVHGQSPKSCFKEINIALCGLLPPYRVEFTSQPPGFNPVLFNAHHPGPFNTGISYVSTLQNTIPDGEYEVKVTDACGNILEGELEVKNSEVDDIETPRYKGCFYITNVQLGLLGLSPVSVFIEEAPEGFNHTLPYDVSSNIDENGVFSMDFTIPGLYIFTGMDECGRPFARVIEIKEPAPYLDLRSGNDPFGCITGFIRAEIIDDDNGPVPYSLFITTAPAAFTEPLPYDASRFITIFPPPNSQFYSCRVYPLPPGDYTLVMTDVCGRVFTATINVPPNVLGLPNIDQLRGCALGEGSIKMSSLNGFYNQVIITAAPPAYNHPLPHNVSFNIESSFGSFYMNSLPAGDYTFHTKDICNVEQDVTVTILGYDILQNDITVIGNCSSFDLNINYRLGIPVVHGLWLQKQNPATGRWEHPITGIPYTDGRVPTSADSYFLNSESINYNIAAYGYFRILKYNIYYSNGAIPFSNCFSVMKEFEFTGELKILSASAISCNGNGRDVIITADGIAPLSYRITSKNGQEFIVENGNSNIFTGLTPGIYNFEVRDLCGNILNRLLDITTLLEPVVTPSALCEGQNGQLSVQPVSFLSYQWWKGEDTATILSTANTLNFNPFSNALSPGTYHVRMYSTSSLSCIDKTISYQVTAITGPNAGQDGIKTQCGTSNVNLFTVLGAPYDASGVWRETTTSGRLNGNVWSPAGIPYGTYLFTYTVTNSCGFSDDALVTVHLNPIPPDPVIHAEPGFCSNEPIRLEVELIPDATYEWTGPNGFHSTEQNPTIANASEANEGVYTVVATVNACQSNASVMLNRDASPNFRIVPLCVNGIYTISAVPLDNSFDTQAATYSWTGPADFRSTQNPAVITGLDPGEYAIIVANAEGCPASRTIQITNTRCITTVPNVITPNNDNDNDVFDLKGLDVSRLEIFNRWGRLVYAQDNYTDQWHGQNTHGEELPDSTYYYIVYLKSGTEQNGWVYKFTWK